MAKRDQLLALYDLAERKGYDVTQSTMRGHIRRIGPDGGLLESKIGGQPL